MPQLHDLCESYIDACMALRTHKDLGISELGPLLLGDVASVAQAQGPTTWQLD